MKSLKTLSLFCVLLAASSQFANADPISGGLYSTARTTSDLSTTLTGSPAKSSQGFRFDNTAANSALFPISNGTSEVNHLLSVALDTTPPVVAASNPRSASPAVNASGLAAEVGFEDPAGLSAIPSPTNGAPAFHLGASAVAAVALEPSSLIILGTGLICAATIVLRRRRTIL